MKCLGNPSSIENLALMRYFNDREKSISPTLSVDGWYNNIQTIEIACIDSDSEVVVAPDSSSYDEYCRCAVKCISQDSEDNLIFMCKEVPTTDLVLNIVVLTPNKELVRESIINS